MKNQKSISGFRCILDKPRFLKFFFWRVSNDYLNMLIHVQVIFFIPACYLRHTAFFLTIRPGEPIFLTVISKPVQVCREPVQVLRLKAVQVCREPVQLLL